MMLIMYRNHTICLNLHYIVCKVLCKDMKITIETVCTVFWWRCHVLFGFLLVCFKYYFIFYWLKVALSVGGSKVKSYCKINSST